MNITIKRPPQIKITCPENSSSLRARITQLDGSEVPGMYTRAEIIVDWEHGEVPVVDLTCLGPSLDIAAGIRSIEIDGKKYRLVECDHVRPMPDEVSNRLDIH